SGSPELRLHAIRMIGVGGDTDTLAGLAEIYKNGDRDVRDSVLRAYLIADDSGAVYAVAVNATSEEEFEAAVRVLGAMGATNELRQLGDRGMTSESLIHAYAIAEDLEALNKLALDASNPETQIQAIQGLGIIGEDEANAALMEIYRGADRDEVKRAALHGMLVAGHAEGVLELFRASQDATEKRELLQLLVIMDSDAALDIISATLESDP
ncbi:MAG: HEAT repeat domain-containing protein, partial [Gammaproteobacteria bacterium]|nr:HEAT repeat domain-containing protein [Gammaproteobacteria bacterium]